MNGRVQGVVEAARYAASGHLDDTFHVALTAADAATGTAVNAGAGFVGNSMG